MVRLGISVARAHVRAVLTEGRNGRIAWVGSAPWAELAELADVVARLAGVSGRPVRRARVVVERDLVQLRTVIPAPPLGAAAMRRYVALEAPRLFQRNGASLVTDGAPVVAEQGSRALWAAATSEPLVRALLDGCTQAGLAADSVGPAADVLPLAFAPGENAATLVLPNGGAVEILEVGPEGVWRSRLVRGEGRGEKDPALTPDLAALGPGAIQFAAAYAAALAAPRLSLLPPDERAARERVGRRRVTRLATVGGVLWVLALAVYVGRLAWTDRAAARDLAAIRVAADSGLDARGQLALARATLKTVDRAQRTRSRHLVLLEAITRALGDSSHLVAFEMADNGTVRLAGYAPAAARVVANLERVEALSAVRLEGPVSRETKHETRDTRDRFAIVAQWGGP